jgi:repressor LexA
MNGKTSNRKNDEQIRVPVLCEAFGGKPVLIESLSIAGWREIRAPKGARAGDRFAAVPICGDSLVEDHITNGDILIVQLTKEARVGDLIIALTPDGLTVKYIHAQVEGMVLLRGANSMYEDQIWDASEIQIQGVVRRIERDI